MLSRSAVLAAAIRLARDGFDVSKSLADSLENSQARLIAFRGTANSFYPGGKAPLFGARLRQPDLARTLQRIAASGSDGFYKGETSRLVAAEMKRHGGLITEADLAGEIGKVICGELAGRESDDQITIFDSTGIALQDSATVRLEYERAVAAGVGVEKKMIST